MIKKCKGLVMEASFETLVVMTPTGEFINLPWWKREIPALGSEIEFKSSAAEFNLFSFKKLGVLAASIIFFLLAIPFVSEYFFPSEQQVIAYVGIDINPSLELGVDKEGLVKEARGLNEDGKGLIKDLQFENLSLDKAIKLITQEAVAKQYITSDKENNIIITYCTREERAMKNSRKNREDEFAEDSPVNSDVDSVEKTGDQIEEETPEQIKAVIKEQAEEKTEMLRKIQNRLAAEIKNELKKQNIEAQVEMLEIQPEFYNNAKKAKLSPGKYAVMLQAMNEGFDVRPEDVKFSSVVHAIKEAGGNPGEIISRAKKAEKHLIEMEKEMQKRLKKQALDEKNSTSKEQIKDKNEEQTWTNDIRDNGNKDKDKDKEKVIDKNKDNSKEKGKEKFKNINKDKGKQKEKVRDTTRDKVMDKDIPKDKERDKG